MDSPSSRDLRSRVHVAVLLEQLGLPDVESQPAASSLEARGAPLERRQLCLELERTEGSRTCMELALEASLQAGGFGEKARVAVSCYQLMGQ